jgi:hypothetical protein
MREALVGAASERLELAAYRAEFRDHFWQVDELGVWKLERQQFFQEPGYASWEAFARGDWRESLRLIEAERPALAAEHRRIAEQGFTVCRVRVVEEPIIPYVQWELHLLRLREQCGTGVRVVTPDQVARFESSGPLPEICTLGTSVMYEIVYNDHGILDGGRRYTNPELIERFEQTYDIDIPSGAVSALADALVYNEVADGSCMFGSVFATSGEIAFLDLVVLEDDEATWPPYYAAVNIREEVLEASPELEELFAPLTAALDQETITELYAEVDVEERDPEEVAETWLSENGFID